MTRSVFKPTTLLLTIILSGLIGASLIVPQSHAVSPNPNARNVTFYFHYRGTPVNVGGTFSHYVTDTAAVFQATNNSVVKPLSQPKIELDFYTYPNLAGPVSFNGTWQVIIWANASALKPTVWNTEYQEVSPGGLVVWDSGLLTPAVIGGPATNNGYLDSPIYAYNLSNAALAHTFTQGDTVRVAVVANPGSTVTAEFWYDSRFFPSQAIFPSVPIAQPSSIWTENSSGVITNAFPATPGLIVTVNSNVTDPFGGYDIGAFNVGTRLPRITLSVTAPNGTVIISSQTMTLISGGPFIFNNVLRYNVTLPVGMSGVYSVLVSSTDNSGNLEQLSSTFYLGQVKNLGVYIVDGENRPLVGAFFSAWSGNYQTFSSIASSKGVVNATLAAANYTLKVNWQGIVVYQSTINFVSSTNVVLTTAVYDVTINVVDDSGAPLSGAVVSVTHPNGTVLPGLVTTGTNGSFSLGRAPAGGWGFTVLWKTVSVYSGAVQISSAGPYTLKTRVYTFTVTVGSNTGQPLQGAYVVLYNSYGVVYDFKSTDAGGTVTLKVPVGTYTVEALYSTTYLYTPVSTSVNKTGVAISSSGSLTLTLAGYPPSIVSTSAFLVLLLAIVGIAAAVLVTYFLMRKRLPKLLAKFQRNVPTRPSGTEPTTSARSP